jgi:Putative peptidoglycan binding domain
VPRGTVPDDDKPRRRRGSIAVEAPAERNLAMRILLHSPKDMVAGALAFAAVSAIIANAIFLQAGRHPSPMFGASVVIPLPVPAPANPLPRPRPVEASVKPAEVKPVESHPVEAKPSESVANLVKTTGALPAAPNVARPPATIPATPHNDPVGDLITSSRRVAAVQRALTEYGYGQLKPTGTVGSDTQAAIQKFERDRKLPVNGQISDRLVRELSAVTGRPID